MNTYRDQFKDIKHRIGSSAKFRNYWWRHVEAVDNGLDTWDVQWAITLLANKQLTIRPKVNLVSNIGFITDSTHTSFDCNHDLFSTKHSIPFPLIHPDSIISDTTADKRTECTITSLQYRLFNFIGSKIPLTKKPLININKVFRKIRGD